MSRINGFVEGTQMHEVYRCKVNRQNSQTLLKIYTRRLNCRRTRRRLSWMNLACDIFHHAIILQLSLVKLTFSGDYLRNRLTLLATYASGNRI